MRRSFKHILYRVLSVPAPHIAAVLEAWRRLWAFSLLAAQVSCKVDSSVVILGRAEVQGTGNIKLGADLLLYRDLYLETQDAGRIEIGDGSVIARGTYIVSYAAVKIGEGAMISDHVCIRDANHNYGDGALVRHSGHTAVPISIGRNVWIGRGSAILPGVTIGDHAVVGANSVVTHDVPAHAVVGGAPARPLPKKEAGA